jgi:hypothetical protein
MKSGISRVGGIVAGIAAFTPAVVAQAPPDLNIVPLARVNIDSFGRVEDPPVDVDPVDASGGSGGSVLCWTNGDRDDVTAQLSQIDPVHNQVFRVADDFFVKAGLYTFVDQVTVCFAVSDYYDGLMNKPRFELHLYDDCSGKPNTPVYSVLNNELDKYTATLVGPSPWTGFNLWSVTFDVQQFLAGYGRWWVCPRGYGDMTNGFFFWVSANNGLIQGAQGQLSDGPAPPIPSDWYDVSLCSCPDTCTDFYFFFTCHRCCLAKNNVPFDPNAGAASLQLKGATIDTARAADNFQIPGDGTASHAEVEICRVEAWFATNCPLEKIFLEIYANDCNMPGAKLCTIDLLGFPLYEDTGQTYNGVPIYHLIWPQITGASLPSGHDYWLSVVARGTGSILDKAYWMYLAQGACNINITEGKVKNPYVAGLEDFTFVSVATSGPPRDFAFKLFTNDIGSKSTAPQTDPDSNSSGPQAIDEDVHRAARELLR